MKNKIILAFILAALSVLAGTVKTVKDTYLYGRYGYMSSVFDRVSLPTEWYPDNRLTKESQANVAALYASAELVAGDPLATNAPSVAASFTAAGMYAPLKAADIDHIAADVAAIAARPTSFAYSSKPNGHFVYTPLCFNPGEAWGYAVFAPCQPYGKYTPGATPYNYTGYGIGLGGRDFNWGYLVSSPLAPTHDRAVATRFANIVNGNSFGLTVCNHNTSSQPFDVSSMPEWTANLTGGMEAWRSSLTLQKSWLWNAAAAISAFDTFYWYSSAPMVRAQRITKTYYLQATLDTSAIRAAAYQYQLDNPDIEKWGTLTVPNAVIVSIEDPAAHYTTETANAFEQYSDVDVGSSPPGSLEGESFYAEIGTITAWDLEESGNWTSTGTKQRVPHGATTTNTYPAKVYTRSIAAPLDLAGATITGDTPGGGSFNYQYSYIHTVDYEIDETPFGSFADNFALDKSTPNKTCYTCLYAARKDTAGPTNTYYLGYGTTSASRFFDSLRGAIGSTASSPLTGGGSFCYTAIPNERPEYSQSVTLDMSQWISGATVFTLTCYYFEDNGMGGSQIDVYDDGQWIANRDISYACPPRSIIISWDNNFEDLMKLKASRRSNTNISFFGAVYMPNMLRRE